MFTQVYDATDVHPERNSPFDSLETKVDNSPQVGTYNDGLVAIVDSTTSLTLLRSWDWLVGPGCLALVTTGFGDVFYWKPNGGVHILDVQSAAVEYVDREPSWFLNEFLTKAGVMELVLRQPRFLELVRAYRPLKYHETFIQIPWAMLGGQDEIEKYDVGACDVYVDLLGQTYSNTG